MTAECGLLCADFLWPASFFAYACSIEIDLPLEDDESSLDKPPPDLVDVTVPPDALPGSEFLVELADGAQFFVVAPDGATPGVTTITIEVPSFRAGDENQPPFSPQDHAESPSGCHRPNCHGNGAECYNSSNRSHPPAPLGGRHPSRDVSDVHQGEWRRLGRYFEWQFLEVERSDGNSSRCTVECFRRMAVSAD